MGLSGSAVAGEPLLTTWTRIRRLAEGVRGGVRDAGGMPLEFGVHPPQETGQRPTARASRVIDAAQDADAILTQYAEVRNRLRASAKSPPEKLLGFCRARRRATR
jgi:hypothetical protein